MKAHFIKYSKESLGYYFYLSDDYNMIVSRHAKFLKRDFAQDGGSGRKIYFEESVSEDQRVIEPVEPISPHRSSGSHVLLKDTWVCWKRTVGVW